MTQDDASQDSDTRALNEFIKEELMAEVFELMIKNRQLQDEIDALKNELAQERNIMVNLIHQMTQMSNEYHELFAWAEELLHNVQDSEDKSAHIELCRTLEIEPRNPLWDIILVKRDGRKFQLWFDAATARNNPACARFLNKIATKAREGGHRAWNDINNTYILFRK